MPNKALIKSIIFLALIFSASSVHAWVEPTTVPPGNNILAPLNSSAFGQSKVGGLILNLGNAAHGLIVRYGLVGIGTDNPQAALDVVGKVRSTGLEVNSTTEGALLPRMTTAERDNIATKVEGLLIYNTETKQLEVYADGAWKASSGGGDSLPKGTIAFFNLSACPSGWAEKTELKGRYPVGLPNSGTLGQSVGTALTNGENRAIGQHSHGVTDPGHSHVLNADPYSGGFGVSLRTGDAVYSTRTTSSSATGISIQNAGSVAGTNAPYIQLLACEKLTNVASGSGTSTTGGSFWQNNGTSIYYNDGNVGVGTSTPSQKMEVAGNVKINGLGNLGNFDGISTVHSEAGRDFRIKSGTGNTYDLYIKSNGNVGIGTSNPTQKMEVAGILKSWLYQPSSQIIFSAPTYRYVQWGGSILKEFGVPGPGSYRVYFSYGSGGGCDQVNVQVSPGGARLATASRGSSYLDTGPLGSEGQKVQVTMWCQEICAGDGYCAGEIWNVSLAGELGPPASSQTGTLRD